MNNNNNNTFEPMEDTVPPPTPTPTATTAAEDTDTTSSSNTGGDLSWPTIIKSKTILFVVWIIITILVASGIAGTLYIVWLDGNSTSSESREEDAKSGQAASMYENQILVIIAMVIVIITTLTGIASLAYVFAHKTNKIITMAQPQFLIMALIGATGISACTLFRLIPQITGISDPFLLNQMCIQYAWRMICYQICLYMGLFGKVWPIKKVLRIRKGQPPVKVWHTSWPFCVMLLLAMTILFVWSFVDPPYWATRNVEKGCTSTIGYCNFQWIYWIPLQIIPLFTQVLGIWMAWETRKAPQELSDGKWIICLHCINLVAKVVFHGMSQLGEIHNNFLLMLLGHVLLPVTISLSACGLLLLPKIYLIRYEQKHGNLPEGFEMFGGGRCHVTIPTGGTQSESEPKSQKEQNTTDAKDVV